ncbi:hypothetical protein ACFL12_05210 [Pseudomonadota bacterium]
MAKQTVFHTELNKGEELLWCAQPGISAFVLSHMRAIFMGLPFIAFAWVWQGWVMKNGVAPVFGTVTWLSLAVGLLYWSVLLAAYVRGSWFTFYGMTKSRLLIMTLYPRRKCEAYNLKDLNQLVVRSETGGSGTLLFCAPGMKSSGVVRPHPGLYGIEKVSQVEESIRTLRDPKAALAKHSENPVTASGRAGVPAPSGENGPRNFTPSSHTADARV